MMDEIIKEAIRNSHVEYHPNYEGSRVVALSRVESLIREAYQEGRSDGISGLLERYCEDDE